jgi:hypothetical protein
MNETLAPGALLAELEETAGWLDERAGVLLKIAADLPSGGPQSASGARLRAIQVEAARFRGRAALLRQIIAKGT